METTLGKACILKSGKFIAASELQEKYEEGLFPCFGGNGVRGYVTEYSHEGTYPLIGRQGALCGNVNYASGKFRATEHAVVVQPIEKIDTRWLYYKLKAMNLGQYATGAAQPGLAVSKLEQLPLTIPLYEEQKRTAKMFDLVEQMIALRKEQLAKLDQLVKSRFIELFGDPIRNTQNRPTTDFINVVMMQRGFDLPVQDRQQDGEIPVYGSNGALDRHNVAKVRGGGVITGRSGTIGKVYYTEGDYWPLNTSLFSVDTHGNNIVYLAYLLQMYDLPRFTEGTGVPTLNRNKFHDKPIIDVPLNEQERFAMFVKQTDKSKLAIQQSLDKLELLKKSLMQEYFG